MSKKRAPRPTRIFRAYWHFAAERQRIFRDRLLGRDWSTQDDVLRKYRFTNAYRASDRVSQYLIQHVIYDKHREWDDVFFRIVLFKVFNRIETWIDLEKDVGSVELLTFNVEHYADALDRVRSSRGTLYSPAYIMPPAASFGSTRKHVNHLKLIQLMLTTRLPQRLVECRTAGEVFSEILTYPSIGPFLAYQLLTDLSYATALPFPESQFVCAGPGALDGLHKCFADPGDFTPNELIAWTTDRQDIEFEGLGIEFDDLWGRPLQLIDCQNLFCEISKYSRAAYPDIMGRSGRTRIKQGFRPRAEPLTAWYPPKWGLNERVDHWVRTESVQGSVSAS